MLDCGDAVVRMWRFPMQWLARETSSAGGPHTSACSSTVDLTLTRTLNLEVTLIFNLKLALAPAQPQP